MSLERRRPLASPAFSTYSRGPTPARGGSTRFARSPRPLALLVLCLGLAATAPLYTAARSFHIDPARSRASIAVDKAGVLSFAAGHAHEVAVSAVNGTVTLDSDDVARATVRLEIDAGSLKVTGKGEPPKDVPEVQRVMLSDKVLDVARYPKILFQSTGVKVEKRTSTTLDVIVAGTLTLHNVARPISVPIHVVLEADTLTASGRFQVKQTDHGIKPVSVAGVVNVKDALDVTFAIVARERQGR